MKEELITVIETGTNKIAILMLTISHSLCSFKSHIENKKDDPLNY